MSLKSKLLGQGLLAALAISAITMLTGASAETGGHFVTNDVSGHTILKGEDKPGNTIVIVDHHYNEAKIICTKDATYHGTLTTQTVTEITLTPTFPTGEACKAELPGLGVRVAHIDANGCDFSFTIGASFNGDNTTHIKCPVGKHLQATVTSPFGTCTVTIKPQTPASGSGYYSVGEEGNKHEITVKPTLREIHAEYIGGPFKCGVAEGTTSKQVSFDNRISLKAYNTAGEQRGITATGSKD
jgi:hypothetical protein